MKAEDVMFCTRAKFHPSSCTRN